ncbi:MAG: asparagine--tRNA ligase [Butyricicoccus sp.]
MKHLTLCELFNNKEDYLNKEILVKGWIRHHRKQKTFGFINFYDGTCMEQLQIVYDNTMPGFDEAKALGNGSAIAVTGTFVPGNKPDTVELHAAQIALEGACPEDYPLQPKKHSLEFLREISYLRPRTRLFQAVFKVRSVAAAAVHEYFQSRGYVYVHTPLITSNDAEGAGNTFQVTTLPLGEEPDYSKDFFGKPTQLAVSGQLEAETFAMGFSRVYTFGPTFRAENSNTKTHMAEFWMIEPEIAFCDLDELMDIEEDFLKGVIAIVLERCQDELKFLSQFNKTDLIGKLTTLLDSNVARVTHKDAITILKNADVDFVFQPEYGEDLAKEHEKYLTEVHFKSPVFVYDWPKDIKAFYMYQNDDGETVGAVDLLVPGAGELMGGSRREDRYDRLMKRVEELNISADQMYWYLNLRKFGSCTHSGFGMGFERLVMYVTGMENIRDVIPYYRTPQNCDF